MPTDLQKSLGVRYAYVLPAPLPTSVTVNSSLSATVSGPADQPTPDGQVTFTITGNDGSSASCTGGGTITLAAGSASWALPAGALRAAGSPHPINVRYNGTAGFAPSDTTTRLPVAGVPTTIAAAPLALLPRAGHPVPVVAVVLPSRLTSTPVTGTVTLTYTGNTTISPQ